MLNNTKKKVLKVRRAKLGVKDAKVLGLGCCSQ